MIHTAVHVPASLMETTCALRSMASISTNRMATMKAMKPPKNNNSSIFTLLYMYNLLFVSIVGKAQ